MITDFGLSKNLAEQAPYSEIRGIHGYIEPQCYKNRRYKRNKKSDIYSLGVLIWEISSGRVPFSDDDQISIAIHIRDGLRETPVENTPLVYQQLYQECWSEEPDLRPEINKVYETLTQLLIEQRIKDDGITFFDYSEFRNTTLIGKGAYGKAYKADVINHGEVKVVALKKIKGCVDELVKEV